MNVEATEKKLREAAFFLDKMEEEERRSVGDREPFDFYLSAFLSATMTVRKSYHYRQGRNTNKEDIKKLNQAVTAWRKTWEKNLTRPQKSVYSFLGRDRNAEVHGAGSRRAMEEERTQIIGDTHSDDSGTTYISSAPGTPPGEIIKPSYKFRIRGKDRSAVEVCAEYLTLLNEMLQKFKADHAAGGGEAPTQ
jgi:hypothetical protein